MAIVEVNKAGMHVNADGEVLGWVNAGDEIDFVDGDTIVTHHKTAEKMGLLEQFTKLKPAKAPKAPKAEGEAKVRGPKVDIPEDGTYTVIKPEFGCADANAGRAAMYKCMMANTSVSAFVAEAVPYKHVKRDGAEGPERTALGELRYAIKRGAVRLN